MLKKLADAQGVDTIEQLDDVVPLLFEHTVYKSYPPSLLEKRSFAQINKWLGKLVTPEVAEAIAAVNVSDCQGLDDWFETMDEGVPQLRISHTSGTSGTLSFLPQGVHEWDKFAQLRKMMVWNMEGPDTPEPNLHTIYPYYRKGYLSHVRVHAAMIPALLPDESHFHAAYPTTLSTDVLHLGAKLRAAQSKGTLDRLVISPELLEKKKAFDQLQAEMPQHLATFFDHMSTQLKGQRVYIGATWNLLHSMAKAGLERGLEGVFHPDSFVHTAGGGKGVVQPEGWREDVLRFTGAKTLNESYAMSEIVGGAHARLRRGPFPLRPHRHPLPARPGDQQAAAAPWPRDRACRLLRPRRGDPLGRFYHRRRDHRRMGQALRLRPAELLRGRADPALQRTQWRRRQDHLCRNRRLPSPGDGFPEHIRGLTP